MPPKLTMDSVKTIAIVITKLKKGAARKRTSRKKTGFSCLYIIVPGKSYFQMELEFISG